MALIPGAAINGVAHILGKQSNRLNKRSQFMLLSLVLTRNERQFAGNISAAASIRIQHLDWI